MQVLFKITQPMLVLIKLFLEEVLDGLNIMVGGHFYLLNSLSILNTEVIKYLIHELFLTFNQFDGVFVLCDYLFSE